MAYVHVGVLYFMKLLRGLHGSNLGVQRHTELTKLSVHMYIQ